MMEEATGIQHFRLSIRGGMLILTAAAGVLYLARLWVHDGGLWLAILACALPFSWIVEFAFDEQQTAKAQSRQIQPARVVLVLLLGLIPAAVCSVNVLMSDATTDRWYLPCPVPSMASWGSSALFQRLLFGPGRLLEPNSYAEYSFDYAPLFVIPAVVFVYLCFPIIFYCENSFLRIRSLALLFVATATSAYWFARFLPHAIEFHSFSYITICIVINVVAICGLWGTWYWQRNCFSTGKVVAWNSALALWLFGFSHPFLGN